jgi:hypothetical protein
MNVNDMTHDTEEIEGNPYSFAYISYFAIIKQKSEISFLFVRCLAHYYPLTFLRTPKTARMYYFYFFKAGISIMAMGI